MQAEAVVQFGVIVWLMSPAVLRRQGVLAEVAQVAAAGHDVGVVDRLQQHGMRDGSCWPSQSIVTSTSKSCRQGVVERGDEGGPVAAVLRMGDDVDAVLAGQQSGVRSVEPSLTTRMCGL